MTPTLSFVISFFISSCFILVLFLFTIALKLFLFQLDAALHNEITNKHFPPEPSEPLRDRLIPHIRLVSVHIDKPRVPRYVLEGIIVPSWLPLKHKQDSFLQSIPPI